MPGHYIHIAVSGSTSSGCDELEALAFVRVDGLEPGECKVYRVRQTAGGKVTGGYTIVAVHQ